MWGLPMMRKVQRSLPWGWGSVACGSPLLRWWNLALPKWSTSGWQVPLRHMERPLRFGTLPTVPAYKLNTHTYTGSFSGPLSPSCCALFTFNLMLSKKRVLGWSTAARDGKGARSGYTRPSRRCSWLSGRTKCNSSVNTFCSGRNLERLLTWLSHAKGKQHGAADGRRRKGGLLPLWVTPKKKPCVLPWLQSI